MDGHPRRGSGNEEYHPDCGIPSRRRDPIRVESRLATLCILLMYYLIFHIPFFKLWAYIIGTFVICWGSYYVLVYFRPLLLHLGRLVIHPHPNRGLDSH
ncbi:hypothetical protein BJX99DRAFT_236253 [Aspergillus californicus]